MIKPLTLESVELIAHRLAKQIMSWNEPIPDFKSRYPNILESCLRTPFQTFARKELYPTLLKKAAILFYLLIKNHPFQNGNKRVAVTSLLVFLAINGKWITTPPDELYRISVWVAESLPDAKDGVLISIGDFIKKRLVNLNQ